MAKRGPKRLGERETAELREAFELFDSEKSGKINLRVSPRPRRGARRGGSGGPRRRHELKVLLRALGFQARPPRPRGIAARETRKTTR